MASLTKLIHHSFEGRLGAISHIVNQLGLSDYVLSLDRANDVHVNVVFKVPNAQVAAVWRKLGKPEYSCPLIDTNNKEIK